MPQRQLRLVMTTRLDGPLDLSHHWDESNHFRDLGFSGRLIRHNHDAFAAPLSTAKIAMLFNGPPYTHTSLYSQKSPRLTKKNIGWEGDKFTLLSPLYH